MSLYLIAKRIIDLFGASAGLLLAAPVVLIIAVAIKLESRGPVLFAHPRLGKDGRPFVMLKFRSMYPEAPALRQQLFAENEVSGPVFKIHSDPRDPGWSHYP